MIIFHNVMNSKSRDFRLPRARQDTDSEDLHRSNNFYTTLELEHIPTTPSLLIPVLKLNFYSESSQAHLLHAQERSIHVKQTRQDRTITE